MSLPDINQQSRATGLRIVSWNISGVLDQIKQGAVLRQAKRYGADSLMLQETHLSCTKAMCLLRYGYAQVFHAGFTRGSRGVAVLIHKLGPYIHSKSWIDT